MPTFSLPAAAARVENGYRVYPNSLLFEAGDYPDKQISVSDEDLKRMAEAFSEPVPLNLEHLAFDETDGALAALKGNLGEVRRVWVDADRPNTLRGEVAVPLWLDNALEGKGFSAEILRDSKLLAGGALTYTPRVESAALMAAFKQYTWHGKSTMQDIHDTCARAGAICTRQAQASFVTAGESGALQQLHDLAVKHGATCTVHDTDDNRAYYSAHDAAPLRAGKDERKMNRFAAFIALLRGKGVDITEQEAAQFTAEVEAENKPEEKPAVTMTADSALAAFKAEMEAKFAAVQADNKRLSEALAASEASAVNAAHRTAIDRMVADFRLTPAEADTWRKMAGENPAAFAAALPALEARVPLPQLVGGKAGDAVRAAMSASTGDGDAERLVNLAQARAKEKGESFIAAFRAVCAENPQLAQAHFANRPTMAAMKEG